MRSVFAVAVLVVTLGASPWAQPSPMPEALNPLSALVGRWHDTDYRPNLPGSPNMGHVCEWVRTVVTCLMPGPDGEVGGIVSYAYDPNARRYSVAVVLGAHGQTFAVPLSYDKARGTLQWQIPAKLGGKSLHLRETIRTAKDGEMAYSQDHSDDGATWEPALKWTSRRER